MKCNTQCYLCKKDTSRVAYINVAGEKKHIFVCSSCERKYVKRKESK